MLVTIILYSKLELCGSNTLNLVENSSIWYSATWLKHSERGTITEEANTGLDLPVLIFHAPDTGSVIVPRSEYNAKFGCTRPDVYIFGSNSEY